MHLYWNLHKAGLINLPLSTCQVYQLTAKEQCMTPNMHTHKHTHDVRLYPVAASPFTSILHH